jgi:hypothetical protein
LVGIFKAVIKSASANGNNKKPGGVVKLIITTAATITAGFSNKVINKEANASAARHLSQKNNLYYSRNYYASQVTLIISGYL